MSLPVRLILVVSMMSVVLPGSARGADDPIWLTQCQAEGTATIECLDARLDVLEEQQVQSLSSLDAALGRAGPDGTDFAAARQNLSQIQAQWQGFVDGDCRLLDLVMGDFGGMGGEPIYCLIEHYEARNAQIARWIARVE